jgi:dTDP-4-dehydrorhamnose reductase
MKIMILGGTGMLGLSLQNSLLQKYKNVFIHGNKSQNDFSADITDPIVTDKFLTQHKPNIIINLIALTNVDFCEKNPNLAYQINTKTVQNITNWIISKNYTCKLIHLSTDQIYDLQIGSLNREDDISLKNYYAFSKYASELEAERCGAIILRTNFFGKSLHISRESFSDWILRAIKNNDKINLFNDIFFSPLSIGTLCNLISTIMIRDVSGTFNLGSKEGLSKSEFAFRMAKELNYLPNKWTEASSVNNQNLIAYRPKNMMMEYTKFEQSFNINLPILKDEIKKVITEDYYE